jgi:hypothetical protein
MFPLEFPPPSANCISPTLPHSTVLKICHLETYSLSVLTTLSPLIFYNVHLVSLQEFQSKFKMSQLLPTKPPDLS